MPETVKFVPLTEVFQGLQMLSEAFHNASGSFQFTWGDANRTLVTTSRVVEAVEQNITDEEAPQDQIDEFNRRIEALPGDVYIDLEN
jgi:hypothetical protein